MNSRMIPWLQLGLTLITLLLMLEERKERRAGE
jgi:hypothetical protein